MSRYRKSVSSLMGSEGDISPPSTNGYGTRNSKRRKLNSPSTSPPNTSTTSTGVKSTGVGGTTVHTPMYSRNLDKALKSILSENPKSRTREETSEETNSLPREGIISTASVSSHNSRETTPSTVHGGETPAFITLYEREREGGRVGQEVREEALKMLREWREEWMVEDKRVRELKRKIKNYSAAPPPVISIVADTATTDIRNKGQSRTATSRSSPTGGTVETPRTEEKSRSESPSRSRAMGGRRESITGPNGLTGSYWDVPLDEMGRGSRRRTKA